MASYNRVILIGRLTRDPELRYTSGGLAVCSFSIAVDRRAKNASGERVTDFFRCTAWRQQAEAGARPAPPRPAAAPPRPAAAPAKPPAPGFPPEEDFDDTDPFADE